MRFENPPNPLERVRGTHPWVLDRIIKPPSRYNLLIKSPPLFPPLLPRFVVKRPLVVLTTCLFLFLWGSNAYGASLASGSPIISSLTLSTSPLMQSRAQPTTQPSASSPPAPVQISAEPTTLPKPTATRTSAPNTYTVKSGDSLWVIARKNGITVNALQAANGLTTTLLHVGDELIIPSKAP